jgi:hypothetical protein
MKYLGVLLAGCVSLLAMTAHARADFIITPIAYSLFAGVLGNVFSFSAIYTGLTILGAVPADGARLVTVSR